MSDATEIKDIDAFKEQRKLILSILEDLIVSPVTNDNISELCGELTEYSAMGLFNMRILSPLPNSVDHFCNTYQNGIPGNMDIISVKRDLAALLYDLDSRWKQEDVLIKQIQASLEEPHTEIRHKHEM